MHSKTIEKLSTISRSFYAHALNIIAPPFCAYCKMLLQKREVFCHQCMASIAPIVSTEIQITQKHAMKVFAISEYREPLKTLILAKARSDIIAGAELGKLIWQHTYINQHEFDVIVPVPLHWQRFAKRGFNQAEEIAKVIAQKSDTPVVHALKRTKHTPFQSQVKKEMRASQVKHAFELHKKLDTIRGKHILLVDDVMTTGATLQACAKELLKSKPASITAVVACRTT